jgi:ferredoxin
MPALIDQEKCTGCQACLNVCPTGGIEMTIDDKATVTGRCEDCGSCFDACPSDAITICTQPAG